MILRPARAGASTRSVTSEAPGWLVSPVGTVVMPRKDDAMSRNRLPLFADLGLNAIGPCFSRTFSAIAGLSMALWLASTATLARSDGDCLCVAPGTTCSTGTAVSEYWCSPHGTFDPTQLCCQDIPGSNCPACTSGYPVDCTGCLVAVVCEYEGIYETVVRAAPPGTYPPKCPTDRLIQLACYLKQHAMSCCMVSCADMIDGIAAGAGVTFSESQRLTFFSCGSSVGRECGSCTPAGSGLPAHWSATSCDVNGDGKVDINDLKEQLRLSEQCAGGLTDTERLALINDWLTHCGGSAPGICDHLAELFNSASSFDAHPSQTDLEATQPWIHDNCPNFTFIPDPAKHGAGRPGEGPGNKPCGQKSGAGGSPGSGAGVGAGPGGPIPCGSFCTKPTGAPVEPFWGDKDESDIDFTVSLPGGSFSLSREYTSISVSGAEGQNNNGLLGANWSLPCLNQVFTATSSGCTTPVLATPGVYYTSKCNGSTSNYKFGGADTRLVQKGAESGAAVWLFIQPGEELWTFARPPDTGESLDGWGALTGLPLSRRDAFSATWQYQWDEWDSDLGSSNRCTAINFLTSAGSSPATRVRFEMIEDATDPNLGRVSVAVAERYAGTVTTSRGIVAQWRELVRAEYAYVDLDDVKNRPWLGTIGDLKQVIVRDRVDGVDGTPAGSDLTLGTGSQRVRVTQYRYHGGLPNETYVADSGVSYGDTNGDGLIEFGTAHKLKMVIQSEGVEYAAWKLGMTAEDAAQRILTKADAAVVDSGLSLKVMDLASKIVTQYETGLPGSPDYVDSNSWKTSEQKVREQIIRTGCGCGGGSSAFGVRRTYDYIKPASVSASGPVWRGSMVMREYAIGALGTSADLHNTIFMDYESQTATGVPHLVTEAQQSGTGETMWVIHYAYDSQGRVVLQSTPAACTAYTPASSPTSGPSITISSSTAMSHFYGYSDSGYVVNNYVVKGWNGAVPSPSTSAPSDAAGTSTLVSSYVYDSSHEYLLRATLRYPGGNRVEAVKYVYPSGTTHTVSWGDRSDPIPDEIDTLTFPEGVSQNGPAPDSLTASNYDDSAHALESHSFAVVTKTRLDADGQAVGLLGADGSLTLLSYDGTTGALLQSTQNCPASSSHTPVPSTWGRSGDLLTTTYTIDDLGRTTSVTGPDGATAYTRRELRTNNQRTADLNTNHPQYFATLDFPPRTSSSTFAGPAFISWYSADGEAVRSSSFTVSAAGSSYPSSATLSTELSRSAIDTYPTGQRKSVTAWASVADNVSYTTAFAYDKFGRLLDVTNSNGTLVRRTYDDLDRVTHVYSLKASAPSDGQTLIVGYSYDVKEGEDPPPFGGNGNLVQVFQNDGTGNKYTNMSYDWRDRLERVEYPSLPNEAFAYDNLDRVGAYLLYGKNSDGSDQLPTPLEVSSITGLPTITGIHNSNDRYVEQLYSYRGLPFRTRSAIDPTLDGAVSDPNSTGVEYLESNVWYDPSGRVIASARPNGSFSRTQYDALGRVSATYATDRAPNPSDYTTAFDTSTNSTVLTGGVVVLEQAEAHFIQQSSTIGASQPGAGQVDLMTLRRRAHDSTSSGSLASDSTAIAAYRGTYYDPVSRRIESVDWGTNQSTYSAPGSTSPPTVTQSSPPSVDTTGSDRLVIQWVYDEPHGAVGEVIDGKSTGVRFVFDDLGRRIAVIENPGSTLPTIAWDSSALRWTVAGSSGSASDQNRVTTFVYDGSNHVIKQIAHALPTSGSGEGKIQETAYDYTNPSTGIFSKDVLGEIRYPNASATATNGTASASYAVKYQYDSMGRVSKMTDQNGTYHNYSYDDRSRLIIDRAYWSDDSSAGIRFAVVKNRIKETKKEK